MSELSAPLSREKTGEGKVRRREGRGTRRGLAFSNNHLCGAFQEFNVIFGLWIIALFFFLNRKQRRANERISQRRLVKGDNRHGQAEAWLSN